MTTGAPPPTTRKRSRARTLLPLGVAAWLVLEIWLLTLVARAGGALLVLLLLVGGAVLGGYVIKKAGRRAFRTLTDTLREQQSGAAPAAGPEAGRNGFLMLGGILLMIPGLLSDAAGLLLLLPPLRSLLGRYADRALDRRMGAAAPGTLGNAFQQARMHRPDGKVVQGEVIRDDAPPPGRPDAAGPFPPLTP
ncbi:FxsA family membrane protein [Streptomyces sp. NPDC001941]|uniref:FxsA family membrane protein n=1 Tax=Streptomyces sp. NPDC001941 TaxID=3154659 RepID=UPI0033236988